MPDDDFVRYFNYCPICTAPLEPHPLHQKVGAKICPEHGDFFISYAEGKTPHVIFKQVEDKFIDYIYGGKIPSRGGDGHPGQALICEQTGLYFPSVKRAAELMQLPMGSISLVLNGKRKSVKGYTFKKAEL